MAEWGKKVSILCDCMLLILIWIKVSGPRIHSISIHGFPNTHVHQHEYPWFLDASLQLSIQVWISTLISKQGYSHKYILQRISVNNKYPWMDIHVLWISVFNYPCFYGYPFGYPWTSMDVHALTCYGFSIQVLNRWRTKAVGNAIFNIFITSVLVRKVRATLRVLLQQ